MTPGSECRLLKSSSTSARRLNKFYALVSLQDCLSKFVGETLKDCGEDLLVEISEILFNELAFFRLMQDLDSNSSGALAAKHKSRKTAEQPSTAKNSLKVSLFVCCW